VQLIFFTYFHTFKKSEWRKETMDALQTKRYRRILLALLRVGIGWVFLWAFIDKLFGLGYATCASAEGTQYLCSKAWIMGGSPTQGFLSHSAGLFGSVFQWLAQFSFITDWLFMIGLLCIGVALISGAGVKVASYSGALLLLFMYFAVPQVNNPFLDDHIIYGILLILLSWVHAGHYYGLGKWWANHDIVKKHPWLD
jgi:thiosulfate dehydrogenase (quinone) large subunit